MADTQTLERRFLNKILVQRRGFQKLQFLDNISNFRKFRSVTPFSQQINTTKRNRSTVLVSGEKPETKNCKSWSLLTKIAKFSDQSDKRKFQLSLLLSVLIRILRGFRFFCAFAYKRPNSLVAFLICLFLFIHFESLNSCNILVSVMTA